jgi:cell division protein ZapE
MKPLQIYQSLLSQPGFLPDTAQSRAVSLLDDLYQQVTNTGGHSGWRSWIPRRSQPTAPHGLYFWGGVGRGKTMLMDLFYQAISTNVKCQRTHFHSFMNQIHASLRQKKKLEKPLRAIAQDIAAEVQLLCLDEFVIIDIGDAMIMAGLLETLFAEGVLLVTTSNAAPQDLYRDGLQRARFMPAIDLIQQHCQVVQLDGGEDYRLRFLQQTDLYSVPHDDASEQRIRSYMDQQVSAQQTEQRDLIVNGRVLAHHFCAGDTVWFSFAELCETTRSQTDYLELARFFNTIVVTEIRQMDKTRDDVARRFVLLIDVLYDHHVKLICSAEVSPEQLYLGSRLSFEFERTVSRLLEMQSSEYLAQAHSLQ